MNLGRSDKKDGARTLRALISIPSTQLAFKREKRHCWLPGCMLPALEIGALGVDTAHGNAEQVIDCVCVVERS